MSDRIDALINAFSMEFTDPANKSKFFQMPISQAPATLKVEDIKALYDKTFHGTIAKRSAQELIDEAQAKAREDNKRTAEADDAYKEGREEGEKDGRTDLILEAVDSMLFTQREEGDIINKITEILSAFNLSAILLMEEQESEE